MLMIVSIMLPLACLMLTLHNGKKRNYYVPVQTHNYYASVKKRNAYASLRKET